MNFQNFINTIQKISRDSSFKASPQINLGQLIKLIDACEENKEVVFDFGYLHPTNINSWRGAYSELALNYTDEKEALKKDEFLDLLKSAIGKEFTGWKGGEYMMDESTPVWVANPGNSGHTGVVGVKDCGYKIIILTAYCEF